MSVILIAIVLTKVFLYHKRRMIWVVFVGGVAVAAYLTYPMTKRLLRIPKWTVQRPENNQDGVDTIRIGILGAANIAPMALIYPSRHVPGVQVYAVAARNREKAERFAHRYEIPVVHGSYEDIINDPNIQVIYNPLPNALHKQWTIRALRAGKHVLCEKPIASNAEEATEMKETADEFNKVLVEAFHYRYHPAIRRVKAILESGELGMIKRILAEMHIPSVAFSREDIRFNYSLAGGATMDGGCYPINLVRYLAGEEPKVSSAVAIKYDPQIDDSMRAELLFPSGSIATIDITLRSWFPRFNVRVECENGIVSMTNFVAPFVYHNINVEPRDGPKRSEKVYGDGESTYELQLRAFISQLRGGESCPTDAQDAIHNMRVIDDVYRSAGMNVRGSIDSANQYHNMAESDSIRVAVRVRPIMTNEIRQHCRVIIETQNNSIRVFGPNPADSSTQPKHSFSYDFCFDSSNPESSHFASQQLVYDQIGANVLTNAWNGYNSTLFAYGQTGSGKSYSMMGEEFDPDSEHSGLIPRICRGLFSRISENQCEDTEEKESSNTGIVHSFKVVVKYLEIYNERVRDLLANSSEKSQRSTGKISVKQDFQGLRVREHPQFGPYVEGLNAVPAENYEDIMRIFQMGTRSRTVAATNMNEQSSRSHAIFTLEFTHTTAEPETAMATDRTSKINLVDLAGSERANRTGAEGARLREAGNINKSLSTLGSVINALAENSELGRSVHVPYRNSVLTWLLRESLGGNAKTVMLAAISPADIQYEETMSTLRYAERAKKVVNQAVVNEDPNVALIRQLRAEIEELRQLLSAQSSQPEIPLDMEKIDGDKEILRATNAALKIQNLVRHTLLKKWREKLKSSERVRRRQSSALQATGVESTVFEQIAVHRRSSSSSSSLNSPQIRPQRTMTAATLGNITHPYFVNIHPDPQLHKALVYVLRPGTVYIGREAHPDPSVQSIVLGGVGVLTQHCKLVYHSTLAPVQEDGSPLKIQADDTDEITIMPFSGASVFINGEKIAEEVATKLETGSRVVLGSNSTFLFVEGHKGFACPDITWEETQKELLIERKRSGSDVLQAWTDQQDVIESQIQRRVSQYRLKSTRLSMEADVDEWEVQQKALEEAWRDKIQVSHVVDGLKDLLPLVHEANSIAESLGKPVIYQLDVIAVDSVLGSKSITEGKIGYQPGVRVEIQSHDGDHDQINRQKDYWTSSFFIERLQLMRECYENWICSSTEDAAMVSAQENRIFDPFLDPEKLFSDQVVAVAYIFLEPLAYGLCIEQQRIRLYCPSSNSANNVAKTRHGRTASLSDKMVECGSVSVSIHPLDHSYFPMTHAGEDEDVFIVRIHIHTIFGISPPKEGSEYIVRFLFWKSTCLENPDNHEVSSIEDIEKTSRDFALSDSGDTQKSNMLVYTSTALKDGVESETGSGLDFTVNFMRTLVTNKSDKDFKKYIRTQAIPIHIVSCQKMQSNNRAAHSSTSARHLAMQQTRHTLKRVSIVDQSTIPLLNSTMAVPESIMVFAAVDIQEERANNQYTPVDLREEFSEKEASSKSNTTLARVSFRIVPGTSMRVHVTLVQVDEEAFVLETCSRITLSLFPVRTEKARPSTQPRELSIVSIERIIETKSIQVIALWERQTEGEILILSSGELINGEVNMCLHLQGVLSEVHILLPLAMRPNTRTHHLFASAPRRLQGWWDRHHSDRLHQLGIQFRLSLSNAGCSEQEIQRHLEALVIYRLNQIGDVAKLLRGEKSNQKHHNISDLDNFVDEVVQEYGESNALDIQTLSTNALQGEMPTFDETTASPSHVTTTLTQHVSVEAIPTNSLLGRFSQRAGYLFKRGHFRKAWKRRWCILKRPHLYYYKSAKEVNAGQIRGVLDLTGTQVVWKRDGKKMVSGTGPASESPESIKSTKWNASRAKSRARLSTDSAESEAVWEEASVQEWNSSVDEGYTDEISFEIHTSDRIWYFQASSQEDRNEWVRVLTFGAFHAPRARLSTMNAWTNRDPSRSSFASSYGFNAH